MVPAHPSLVSPCPLDAPVFLPTQFCMGTVGTRWGLVSEPGGQQLQSPREFSSPARAGSALGKGDHCRLLQISKPVESAWAVHACGGKTESWTLPVLWPPMGCMSPQEGVWSLSLLPKGLPIYCCPGKLSLFSLLRFYGFGSPCYYKRSTMVCLADLFWDLFVWVFCLSILRQGLAFRSSWPGPHYVDKAGLRLQEILLSQSSKYRDYRSKLPYLGTLPT